MFYHTNTLHKHLSTLYTNTSQHSTQTPLKTLHQTPLNTLHQTPLKTLGKHLSTVNTALHYLKHFPYFHARYTQTSLHQTTVHTLYALHKHLSALHTLNTNTLKLY